ncbi:TetR/AcrR family transcriptional regulator [Alsobacter soli]|uniref:TetR/AcrR family transcriptional regulator n=2 Tax=Alsobacter soli TaxID=2109933 RepID=A0A2T1HR98_9HYPH|nr:TetR/AcrR family transcriptional regulator [Alsobacter soli]
MPMAKPQRRTQEERSAETRARLVEATLDCLNERGYPRTTTAEIAERAGVTRGALNHHFPSKDALVVRAIEHLLKSATSDIRGLAASVRDGSLSLSDFVERLWDLFSGRLLLITLEHITEARHNGVLREGLIPVVREFHAALDRIWGDFFKGTHLDDREVQTALNASLCLMRGMGMQQVLRDDPSYYRGLLDFWKSILADYSRRDHAQEERQPVRAGGSKER